MCIPGTRLLLKLIVIDCISTKNDITHCLLKQITPSTNNNSQIQKYSTTRKKDQLYCLPCTCMEIESRKVPDIKSRDM